MFADNDQGRSSRLGRTDAFGARGALGKRPNPR